MTSSYKLYKDWWLAFNICYDHPMKSDEEQFEDHINNITLYELMETLEDWND